MLANSAPFQLRHGGHTMDALSQTEFVVALFGAAGIGVLMLALTTRTAQQQSLREEVARRIAESISVLAWCKDEPPR